MYIEECNKFFNESRRNLLFHEYQWGNAFLNNLKLTKKELLRYGIFLIDYLIIIIISKILLKAKDCSLPYTQLSQYLQLSQKEVSSNYLPNLPAYLSVIIFYARSN